MDVLGIAERGRDRSCSTVRSGPTRSGTACRTRCRSRSSTSTSASSSSTRRPVAREAGLGARVNTVLQPCFFALADVLPREEAIAAIKEAIRKTYGKRGELVLERNFAAVDLALAALHEVSVPDRVTSDLHVAPAVTGDASEFVPHRDG